MPTTDNVSKWFKSAELDYFAAFLKLWLSFNAWYRLHYNEDYIKKDRDHINIIRGVYKNQSHNLHGYDASTRNSIRRRFMNLMEFEDIESKEFKKYVEKFLYLFKERKIKGFFDGQIREEKSLEDFFIEPSKTDRQVKLGITKGIYFSFGDSNPLVINNDIDTLYSYIIEIIYQIRNDLVHGDLSCTKEQHNIVKYCYLIIYYITKDLVTR